LPRLIAQLPPLKPESKIAVSNLQILYALAFGLFLGLCLWKFGNPVILDQKIPAPATASDYFYETWPPHWAGAFLAPLAAAGALLAVGFGRARFPSKWLWLLPLIWLAWQFISATHTVDSDLTAATLWQFSGCVAGYFLGATLFARPILLRWLLAGVLAAFAFCLIRGLDQRLFEFPENRQMLIDGERDGWTNFPPAAFAEMKSSGIVLTTNGVDVANPAILTKFAQGRIAGTMVYPNALAQLILLLWPVALALALGASAKLRPPVRLAAIAITVVLGGTAFIWTGSKLGWLVGLVLIGLWLLRLNWPAQFKFFMVSAVLMVGLGVFAVRFHHYFAAGATSAGARLDYWRAAVQTTATDPWFGTGPGTFQRPYARLKAPDAEMARLAHNDYLEQFSDSGAVGGVAYSAWIFLALATLGRALWKSQDRFSAALFLGLLGWFLQGLGEFGLFIPALAWTAFTLLGGLIGQIGGRTDPNSIRQHPPQRLPSPG
jgi:hypothetical protein